MVYFCHNVETPIYGNYFTIAAFHLLDRRTLHRFVIFPYGFLKKEMFSNENFDNNVDGIA